VSLRYVMLIAITCERLTNAEFMIPVMQPR